jgi:hypothetical protein
LCCSFLPWGSPTDHHSAMPEPAEDVQVEHPVADEAVEQPSPQPAAERPKPARRKPDWRVFVRDNARLLVTFALLAAGVVFVILGWYGAAHTNILTEQIPYLISGGLLGLGLIIVAGVLAAGAVQERSNDDLRREIAHALAAMGSGAPDRGVRGDAFSTNGHHVFVVPGGRSFHQPGCPILEGKEGVQELEASQAEASGYAACKLCSE